MDIKYGFVSSHRGGQHTNGADYGIITAEHELAGVRIEIQTSSRIYGVKARDLATSLINLAVQEIVR